MTAKRKTVTISVKIPKCWKKLVDMEFPEDLEGVTSKKYLKGDADPRPHYDDFRSVTGEVGDLVASVSLSSGQSNYYGCFTIYRDNGTKVLDRIYESEPMNDYNDMEAEVNGVLYVIKPKWV